jgi:hypothetical protein
LFAFEHGEVDGIQARQFVNKMLESNSTKVHDIGRHEIPMSKQTLD